MNKSQSQFDQYEQYYIEENIPLKIIADEFDLNYQSLMQHSIRRKWGEKKRKYYEDVRINEQKIQLLKSNKRAKELELKNIRRSEGWEKFRRIIAQMMTDNSKKYSPSDIRALISSYKMCCDGQRLEDGQPTTVIREITELSARNPVFEAILENEDILVEKERQVEKLKKELASKK